MTTHALGTQALSKPRLEGTRFDSVYLIACLWLIAGGYFDSWAHFNIPRLESFFTIWHAALYSGLLAVTLVVIGTVWLNRSRGYAWRDAVPAGYDLALVGVIGFFVAGVGDMCWHILFGIEKNIDAQFSPTHVAIMICFGFIAIAPYRAATRIPQAKQPWFLIPLVATVFLAFFQLLVMPVHPYNFFYPVEVTAAQNTEQTLAVVSYLFYGAVVSVFTQYTIRQWRVPVGFFTILYTITAIAVSIMQRHAVVIGMAVVTGILTDLAYHWIKPTVQNPAAFRLFAALAAAVYYLVYFVALDLLYGVVWTIHLSLGTIVVSALLSWLLSYLVLAATPVGNEDTQETSDLTITREEEKQWHL